MRNFVKKQNGITLIALVVTIIVLIILAGVSIAMLVGDNGIITKAQEATKKTESASLEEKIKLLSEQTLKLNPNNYCPRCGNKVDGNFCSKCGLKQQ